MEMYRLGLGREMLQRALGQAAKVPSLPPFGEEIFVPGQNGELHRGFVNCKNNAIGLKAKFYKAGEDTGVAWENQGIGYEGYHGIIHGGITAALLDEVMATAAFHRTQKYGITVKATFKWHKTLKVGDPVKGFARVNFLTTQFARVSGHIFRGDQKLVASSEGVFYFPTLKQFKHIAELELVPPELEKYFRLK